MSLAGLLRSLGLAGPTPGVPYQRALAAGTRSRLLPILGILLGVMTFWLASGAVAQGLIALFWGTGLIQASDLRGAYRQAIAFETPWGMLAVHLGLATLIPISLALVAVVHRVQPRWVASVRPWFRWRFLALALVAALVVLNLALRVSSGFSVAAINPKPGFPLFLAVILLSAPLQAAAEEFFFRGYLMQAVGCLVRNPWLPIVASAALFAAFHGPQNLPLLLDRFGFGLLAGVLVYRTGGLEAAIAIHIANNVLAFGYAGLTSTIAQVKAVQAVGWTDVARDLLSFASCALVAWWIGRRLGVATLTPERPV